MKIVPKLASNEDAHALLQMTKVEHEILRDYLGSPLGKPLKFPRNVNLMFKGNGWYTLLPGSAQHGIKKIQDAIQTLENFQKSLYPVQTSIEPLPIDGQLDSKFVTDSYRAADCDLDPDTPMWKALLPELSDEVKISGRVAPVSPTGRNNYSSAVRSEVPNAASGVFRRGEMLVIGSDSMTFPPRKFTKNPNSLRDKPILIKAPGPFDDHGVDVITETKPAPRTSSLLNALLSRAKF